MIDILLPKTDINLELFDYKKVTKEFQSGFQWLSRKERIEFWNFSAQNNSYNITWIVFEKVLYYLLGTLISLSILLFVIPEEGNMLSMIEKNTLPLIYYSIPILSISIVWMEEKIFRENLLYSSILNAKFQLIPGIILLLYIYFCYQNLLSFSSPVMDKTPIEEITASLLIMIGWIEIRMKMVRNQVTYS